MKLSSSFAIVFLAFSSAEAVAVPSRHIWTRALNARTEHIGPVKRQINIGGSQRKNETQQQKGKPQRQAGGGLTIGGLTLGGASGGLSAGTLQLGGNRKGNGQQQAEGQNRNATLAVGEQGRNATEAADSKASDAKAEKPAAKAEKPTAKAGEFTAEATEPVKEAEKPSSSEAQQTPIEKGAGAGTENQPGRAEGEAAKEEALNDAKQQGKGEAAKAEKSNGVKATEESERFSEESGITLDQTGKAQNLGGNLGITEGTDGSKSVGGENGINIASNGKATLAGNE